MLIACPTRPYATLNTLNTLLDSCLVHAAALSRCSGTRVSRALHPARPSCAWVVAMPLLLPEQGPPEAGGPSNTTYAPSMAGSSTGPPWQASHAPSAPGWDSGARAVKRAGNARRKV